MYTFVNTDLQFAENGEVINPDGSTRFFYSAAEAQMAADAVWSAAGIEHDVEVRITRLLLDGADAWYVQRTASP